MKKFINGDRFRKIIKQRRLELGYSMQDVGNYIGTDRNTIKLIEDGKIQEPGFIRVFKIFEALGLDASDLMEPQQDGSKIEQICLLINQDPAFSKNQKQILVSLLRKQADLNQYKISKILLVDDQEIFLRGAKALLEKNGFIVNTAFNFDSALKEIKQTNFDLILLDIDLKEERNGLDILKAIKKNLPDLPCVMLSGIKNQQIAQQAMQAGAFDYIDKNEDIEKVFLVINKIEEYKRLKVGYESIEGVLGSR